VVSIESSRNNLNVFEWLRFGKPGSSSLNKSQSWQSLIEICLLFCSADLNLGYCLCENLLRQFNITTTGRQATALLVTWTEKHRSLQSPSEYGVLLQTVCVTASSLLWSHYKVIGAWREFWADKGTNTDDSNIHGIESHLLQRNETFRLITTLVGIVCLHGWPGYMLRRMITRIRRYVIITRACKLGESIGSGVHLQSTAITKISCEFCFHLYCPSNAKMKGEEGRKEEGVQVWNFSWSWNLSELRHLPA